MENLKQRFLEMHGIDNYQRVDSTHPIPLYIGLDSTAQYSLFCVTETLPTKAPVSSRIISVFVGKRQDGTYGITFSLADQTYLDHFICFCVDIYQTREDSYRNWHLSRALEDCRAIMVTMVVLQFITKLSGIKQSFYSVLCSGIQEGVS